MRRDLEQREYQRQIALAKFRSPRGTKASGVSKKGSQSKTNKVISQERRIQTDDLNRALTIESKALYRTIGRRLKGSESDVEITIVSGRIIASKNSISIKGAVKFRLANRSARQQSTAIRRTTSQEDFIKGVGRALRVACVNAVKRSGHGADTFDDLILVVGSVGLWSNIRRQRAPLKVLETRMVSAPRSVPSAKPSERVHPPFGLLDWEVLPPGWWSNSRRGRRLHSRTRRFEKIDPERIEVINSLGPIAWYEGRSLGIRHYFVATFPRVAIADSPDWGNALYYYTGEADWRSVFRRSKRDALSLGARRILHSSNWHARVESVVAKGYA